MAKDKRNIQFRIQAVDNFTRTMRKLDRQLSQIDRKVKQVDDVANINVNVVGDKKAKRDLEKVNREANKLQRKILFIKIGSNIPEMWKIFRRDVGRIAELSRDVGEYFRSQFTSAIAILAPTLVSGIYSIVAALGAMLPVIGVVGGGILGLGSAFVSAGAGVGAFVGLAIPALKKVMDASSELKDLQEELAETDDLEERKEILEKIEKVYAGLSKEQRNVLKSSDKLRSSWDKLSKSLEPKVLTVFANGIEAVESVLKRVEPMFKSVADTAVELSEAFKMNLDSQDFTDFIRFLNKTAAPMMDTMSRAVGNFAMGFTNLMVAFGPLAEKAANGLADMARRFREWTAGLSDSDRFNAFMDYVADNAPKLLTILANLRDGFVGIGEAFAPFASDLLTKLVDMTQNFEDWGKALKDNPEFKEFIEFVKEEGPNFLTIMGEFRELIMNLAEGFAEVSRTINPVIEGFLQFTNSIMEANPWIAKAVAWLTTLIGVAGLVYGAFSIIKLAITPLILMFGFLKKPLQKLIEQFGKLNINLGGLGGTIIRLAGRFFFITSILMLVLDAARYFWDEIESATRTALTNVGKVVENKLQSIENKFNAVLDYLNEITGGAFSDIFDSVKEWMQKSLDKVREVWDFIEETFELGLKFVKAVLDGDLGEAWDIVKEQLGNIEDTFTEIWDDIVDFLEGIDLYEIGKSIISGLARGITNAKDSVVKAVSGAVGGAISRAKGLLRINSPSKVFRDLGMGTGEGFIQGISRMNKAVSNATGVMIGGAIPSSNNSSSKGFTRHPSYFTNASNSKSGRTESGETARLLSKLIEETKKNRELVVEMDKTEVARVIRPELVYQQSLVDADGRRFK